MAFAVLALVVGCSTSPVPVVRPPVVTVSQSDIQLAKDNIQITNDATEIAALKTQIRNPFVLHVENFIRFCVGCVVGIVIGLLICPVLQILDAGLATSIEKDEAGVATYIAKFFTWIVTLFSGKKSTAASVASGSTTKG
jgi:hypothetical protein